MGASGRLRPPPRIVLDTNVLVSAPLFGGEVAWLREAWQINAAVPLASRATVSELIRVLACPKFRLSAGEREAVLAEYLPWCESVDVPESTAVPACRDPHDAIFLRLAVAAHADALLTGDADVLSLDGTISVPIVRPASMGRHLRAARPPPRR